MLASRCFHGICCHLLFYISSFGHAAGGEKGWLCGCVSNLVAQGQRTCLPMRETQEMQVQPLGQEDPLEEEMATHSSILAWETPFQRSLVGSSPWVCKESDTTEWLSTHPGTCAAAQGPRLRSF